MKPRSTPPAVTSTSTRNDVDLDALALALAPRVAALLVRGLTAAPAAGHYDNASPPPGWSRRRWREHAHELAGSYRDGRAWRITRADFDAHTRSRMTSAPATVAAANDATSSPAWSPDAALAEAGFRATRAVDPKGGR